MKNIIKRLKFLDLLSPIFFMITLIPAKVFKVFKKDIILICEDPNQACDNGFEYYKFLIDEKKIQNVYYAINYSSTDYHKFSKRDYKTVNFGSLKHWILYLSASQNISVHKAGSPSPALFHILHKLKLFNGNRIFLQHGVTMNKVDYLLPENCNFTYFTCAAYREYDYLIEEFGYSKEVLKLTGFSRFDALFNAPKRENRILAIMPTWRSYLQFDSLDEFIKSNYFQYWNGLLNNEKFIDIIEKEKVSVIFYPHRNVSKFAQQFYSSSDSVTINSSKLNNIQDLIINSSAILTDYSSLSIDFAYINKPVHYYQFDLEEFESKHLAKGYFSYEEDGFGPVNYNLERLLESIDKMIKSGFKNDEIYEKRINDFFKYVDNKNCQRIFELLNGGQNE